MLRRYLKMDNIVDITKVPTFYINLDEEEERRDKVESLLKEKRFKNFGRLDAIQKQGRSVGCSTSHRDALQYIVDNKIFPALILEDDVEVFDFRKKIKSPHNADAMYLGFSRYGWNHNQDEPFPRSLKIKELGKDYHRVQNMLARHAVIHFNPDYSLACIKEMDKFLSDPEKYIAGDIQIASIHSQWKVYAQNSPIFYQEDQKTRALTKHAIYDCEYVEMDKL